MVDLYNRLFIYSPEQKKDKSNIASNMGQTYSPGQVVIKGRSKPFTDIITSMDKCQYGDATVVCQGDIRRIEYKAPSQK